MEKFNYSELPNTILLGLNKEVVNSLAAFYSAETDRYEPLRGNVNTFMPTIDDFSKRRGKRILSGIVSLMEPMPIVTMVKVLDNGFCLVFRCKNVNNEIVDFILNYGNKYDFSPRIVAIKNGKAKVSKFDFNGSGITFEPSEYEENEYCIKMLDEAINKYEEQQSHKKVKKYRR